MYYIKTLKLEKQYWTLSRSIMRRWARRIERGFILCCYGTSLAIFALASASALLAFAAGVHAPAGNWLDWWLWHITDWWPA